MTALNAPRVPWFATFVLALVFVLLSSCGPSSGTPQVSRTIHVGYTSQADYEDLPSLIAHQRLRDMRYTVETTFFAQPGLAIEALARGQVDFTHSSIVAHWTAVSQGAEIVTLMEHTSNAWLLVTIPEIRSCQDLDGRRMAHHSEGGTSKALTDSYLQEQCPSVEPDVLIMPGSSNRAAALIAGEIDVTPIRIPDLVQIEREAPGQFSVLVYFSEDLPNLKVGGVHTNLGLLSEQPQVVTDYVTQLVRVYRDLGVDQEPLIEMAMELLEMEPEIARETTDRYLAIQAWKPDGGLSLQTAQASIDFWTAAGELPPGIEAAQVVDLGPLEAALGSLGP